MRTHINMKNYHIQALIGAGRYAAADKSDPFAYNRAISHLNNGLCKPIVTENGDMKPGHYDAERDLETRTFVSPVTGEKEHYRVEVYKDVKRV